MKLLLNENCGSRIRDAVKTVLDTTTIEDLAKYSEIASDDGYMFYI